MSDFKLNTSGDVIVPSSHYVDEYMVVRFSDLSPFVQGYVEWVLRALHNAADYDPDNELSRYDRLAPETLARIIEDCAYILSASLYFSSDLDEPQSMGRKFWVHRQHDKIGTLPPLTVYLGDEGLVRFQ